MISRDSQTWPDSEVHSIPEEPTMEFPKAQMSSVAALNGRTDLTFVSDSQDAEAIREHVGSAANGYDAFFVKIADGDYTEVWGMCGIVPYLSKLVTRIL